ncbi:PTS lactose/cellobiose transporter subunit IIA [Bacillus sp. B1-b2]|nr:PTS lactose/cellobiose transporter subunit IIA [Bacillus sp. B1-b2]KAB7665054.1 PTS lactose/cellobiose transporter subunit IIA [Bacillus sp. B1-b2]
MKNEREIMQIITTGGDARANYLKALAEAREGNWEKVDSILLHANDSLNLAHNVQTSLIQSEIRGEEVEISLLMVHAQDHLMNAITVKELVCEMIKYMKQQNG